MAYVNLCGFETGDFSETEQGSPGGSGVTVQNSIVRTGSYALRINATGWGVSGSGSTFFGTYGADGLQLHATSYTKNYVRFYLYIGTSSGAETPVCIQLSSGFASVLQLTYQPSSGKLRLLDSSGTLQGTASTTISTGAWHLIEIDYDGGASPSIAVRQDGSQIITSTNAAFASKNGVRIYFGTFTTQAAGPDFYIDDFAWRDDQAPGDGSVRLMLPDGDSLTNTGWTASAGNKWQCVDEIPPNAATDYVSNSSNGGTYTATLQSSSDAGINASTIGAVKALIQMEGSSGSSSLRVRIRSGGSNSDNGSNYSSTGVWTILARVLSADPTDAAAWTATKLDALEVGAVSNNTSTTLMSSALAMVDYAPYVPQNYNEPIPQASLTLTGESLASAIADPIPSGTLTLTGEALRDVEHHGGAPGDSIVHYRGVLGPRFLPVGAVNVPVRSEDVPPVSLDATALFFGALQVAQILFPGPAPIPVNVARKRSVLEQSSLLPLGIIPSTLPVTPPSTFGEERVDFKYDFGSRWR